MAVDEVRVEPKSGDDKIIREPADHIGEVPKVLAHGPGDLKSARVVIAACQEDAGSTGRFVRGEPFHHGGAAVEVRPALEVGERNVELPAYGLEEVAQVELLD